MKLQAMAKNLFDIDGVVGVGSSNGLKVFIESEDYLDAVPMTIAGRPVEVVVTGKLKAMPLSISDRCSKVRPLVGGISISNEVVSAGTLGVVWDGYILTNAHVIAMDENADFVKSTKIYQPGLYDGGQEVVGNLVGYAQIQFNDTSADNYVDFAVGEVNVDYASGLIAGDEEDYNIILNSYEPKEGEEVRKTGRTSGTTYGSVESTSAFVKVWYTDSKWAAFHDVILVKGNPFMEAGDSGSFVDKDELFVGLGFAGNPTTGYGVVCKAKYVLYAFNQLTGEPVPLPPIEKPSLLPVMVFGLPLILPFMGARKSKP